jgi:hypothetical protein
MSMKHLVADSKETVKCQKAHSSGKTKTSKIYKTSIYWNISNMFKSVSLQC